MRSARGHYPRHVQACTYHASMSTTTASPGPLHDQGSVRPVSPLAHGTVVIACSGIAQKLQNEESVRRTDTPLSIRHNFLVGC
jgi:hypothetical protein